jgi:hypothetical protein
MPRIGAFYSRIREQRKLAVDSQELESQGVAQRTIPGGVLGAKFIF